jgi:hypothetical protein
VSTGFNVKIGLFFALKGVMTPFIKNRLFTSCRSSFIGVFFCMPFALEAATKEEAIKAGSVYNFTKFAIWPEGVNTSQYFNLCVFSQSKPHAGFKALSGRLVDGKPLMLRHNVSDNKVNSCHMAYIAEDTSANVQKILKTIKKMPILSVSDSPNFINKGGMIGLVNVGAYIGFEVNLTAANNAGLHISAQLLKLAKKVKGLKQPP